MGKWAPDSKATEARIELLADDGTVTVLNEKMALKAGEVLDGTFMNCQALREFYDKQIDEAKEQG
eukprot:10760887-Heterocapsa_arctica.AAC.1